MANKETGSKAGQQKHQIKKPSGKSAKVNDKDEFRKLNTREEKGHLHYVCGRTGNKLQSIGVTHGKRTKGVNNVPLRQNPDPKDKKPAYVRPKLTEKKAKNYGKKLDGLGLSARDKKIVWELIEELRKEKKQ